MHRILMGMNIKSMLSTERVIVFWTDAEHAHAAKAPCPVPATELLPPPSLDTPPPSVDTPVALLGVRPADPEVVSSSPLDMRTIIFSTSAFDTQSICSETAWSPKLTRNPDEIQFLSFIGCSYRVGTKLNQLQTSRERTNYPSRFCCTTSERRATCFI